LTGRRCVHDLEGQLSQKEAADELGVSVRTVKRIEAVVNAWRELAFCRDVRRKIPDLDSMESPITIRLYGIACPLRRKRLDD
jgi:hypothetical protein